MRERVAELGWAGHLHRTEKLPGACERDAAEREREDIAVPDDSTVRPHEMPDDVSTARRQRAPRAWLASPATQGDCIASRFAGGAQPDGEPSPGADVVAVGPVPVQMWQG
jgi:hypothetical protein